MPSIFLALDQLGHLLEQGGLVHHVRQLGDDDRHAAVAGLLEGDLGPDDDAAAAVGVHLADGVDGLVLAGDGVAARLEAEHRAAGREVGTEDVLAEIVRGQLRVVDQVPGGIADLAQVVGRDVGRHADGDPRRAVDEQVRQLGRQDRRLLLGAVVVLDEVDGVLVDVGQHLRRDPGQAGLGVAHRRRAVAVDRAEVALAVDQRIAHREVLGQADQGVVDGRVAVRVVLAHHVADDGRALAIRRGGRQAHLAHGVEDAAMDRLEAVADVGQRPRHDDAHGVVEVARPHLVLDADGSDPAQVVGHGALILRDGLAGARRGARCRRRLRGTRPRWRRRGMWKGRRGGGGCRPGWSLIEAAVSAGSFETESRITQARWPSSVARAVSASASRKADDGGSIRQRQRAKGPREGLLDVGLGVTDEEPDAGEAAGRRGWARARRERSWRMGQRGDGGADQAALPA